MEAWQIAVLVAAGVTGISIGAAVGICTAVYRFERRRK